MAFKSPDFVVRPPYGVYLADPFIKANNTTSPGSANGYPGTTTPWTVHNGTFGILTNQLYKTATESTRNSISLPATDPTGVDQDIRVIFAGSGQAGIIFRMVDINNFMLFQIDEVAPGASRVWRFFRVNSGVYTQINSGFVTMVADTAIRIRVVGDVMNVWRGTSDIYSPGTIAGISTQGTRTGIQLYNLAARVSYFWSAPILSPMPTEVDNVTLLWRQDFKDAIWSSWRVYRRFPTESPVWELIANITSSAADNSYVDFGFKPGVNVEYQVRQFMTNGTETTDQHTVSLTPTSTHYFLVHPTNAAYTVKLVNASTESFGESVERGEMILISRGRHVDYGTSLGVAGTLTCELKDLSGGLTGRQQRLALEALKRQRVPVYLRTPFGDMWKVSLGNMTFDHHPGVGPREFMTVTIPYAQEAT